MRYGVSDRAAAALFNAAMKSLNPEEEIDQENIVDKSKIRRYRDKFAATQTNKLLERIEASGGFQCLGMDGKRNKIQNKKKI